MESDPLTISLVDKVPKVLGDTIAYRVSVCVTSAATGGGKARMRRDDWYIGSASAGNTGPAEDKAPIEPAFPWDGT